jgi:NADPH-dependent curcumin reductase CurA
VDVYFENVGGKVFEGVLRLLNAKARITLCGMIAQYGDTSGQSPRDTWLAAGSAVFSAQKIQVHPLFVGDYVANHQAAFLALMGDYLRQEKVVYLEDFRAGLEVAPTAFGEMLRGGNFGKTLVVVKDP